MTMSQPSAPSPPLHRVVIVGGGFAGLHTAQQLRKAAVQVTLIDRRNFHLFQPLLYQVATGALSPANIASPLREVLQRQKNTQVLLGEVTDVDVAGRRVILEDGEIPYDTLIVAAGASHSYFGNDHWQALAPGLKTIEDATEIRRRVLSAFERAERSDDPETIHRLLTFVVVGGGPTGVELAGALGEITRDSLRGNFRNIDPADATIYLVEGAGRVLPPYLPRLSARAADDLQALGVQVRCGTMVTDIGPQQVTLSCGDAEHIVPTETVIWAAGVRASPLARQLAVATGVEVDRAGRIDIDAHLNLPGHPEIFVLGDMARGHFAGKPLPGVAPVAMQQGDYVGKVLAKRLRRGASAAPAKPFAYFDWGNMATIGRGRAVADLRGLRFGGYLAWLAWLFVHVLKLVGFENRLLVLTQWAWNYITRNRTARLITSASSVGRPGGDVAATIRVA